MKTVLKRMCNKLFLTMVITGMVYSSLGQTMQTYHAKEIEVYKGQDIKTNNKPVQRQDRVPDNDKVVVINRDKDKTPPPAVNPSFDSFFGLYQMWVPGTSYTTNDYANQQVVLHNSAGTGVLPGGLSILKNNTYIWNSSWDQKIIKGVWKYSGDQGYPILLLKAQEGKSWKVGKSNEKNADIIIWDGYTWYNGKRVRK